MDLQEQNIITKDIILKYASNLALIGNVHESDILYNIIISSFPLTIDEYIDLLSNMSNGAEIIEQILHNDPSMLNQKPDIQLACAEFAILSGEWRKAIIIFKQLAYTQRLYGWALLRAAMIAIEHEEFLQALDLCIAAYKNIKTNNEPLDKLLEHCISSKYIYCPINKPAINFENILKICINNKAEIYGKLFVIIILLVKTNDIFRLREIIMSFLRSIADINYILFITINKHFNLGRQNCEFGHQILYELRAYFNNVQENKLLKFMGKKDLDAVMAIYTKVKYNNSKVDSLVGHVIANEAEPVLMLVLASSLLRTPHRADLSVLLCDKVLCCSTRALQKKAYLIKLESLEREGDFSSLQTTLNSYCNFCSQYAMWKNEKILAWYQLLIALASHTPYMALQEIKATLLDYKKYWIGKNIYLYAEAAVLSLSQADLLSLVDSLFFDMAANPDSSSVYCILALLNKGNIEIDKMTKNKLDILIASILLHNSLPGNYSRDLLKNFSSSLLNKLDHERGTIVFAMLEPYLHIEKPYYLQTVPVLPKPVKNRKNIAICFSGFLRNYESSQRIINAILDASEYNIYTFYYLFDKLGNIYINPSMPSNITQNTNGGLYNEIKKTPGVNVNRFVKVYQPTVYSLVERKKDDYYMERIGITHPQWLMVYESFLLAEDFSRTNNLCFDYVVRARTDNFPKNPACLRIATEELESLSSNNILVMDELSYGFFSLSDRFAIGLYDAMKTYCEIGKDKNFLSVESLEIWKTKIKQPYTDIGGSHETHLGAWLKLNGINFIKKGYLNVI